MAEEVKDSNDTCKVCGRKIKIMIFKGTSLCSDNCRKVANGEPISPTPESRLPG